VSCLVSLIVPVYNGEAFIAQAIDSVLAQTYPHWELIVVDDGSTDGTSAVLSRFADGRIRCIHQANQGLAATRNAGIALARGQFLTFLDADDTWEPAFLERCLAVLTADESLAAVYTYSRHIDPKGNVLPQPADECVPCDQLRDRLLEGGFFAVAAVLARAAVVRQVGMFDTGLEGRGTEDWDLWLRISERFPMGCIPELLANYRVYPGSMATQTAGMHANRMSVLAKRFGPPEGDAAAWPEEKRRVYGFAYRTTALGYMQQGEPDEGWKYLAQAVETWPWLLQRLDTFYELTCGDQPRGFRGRADMLDIEANGGEMLRRLETLLAGSSPGVRALRPAAVGNAYLALAMLSDQAGDWSAARRYLLKAAHCNPSLLRDRRVLRRLAKLTAGRNLAEFARRALGRNERGVRSLPRTPEA
jgi:tetratricopeptide (TPR) repeat protein